MAHLLIHHAVKDFSTWKEAYDEHRSARDAAGLTELYLLQGADDPNDVVLLFAARDLDKARAFAASEDLRETMIRAGVVGEPRIIELR